MKKLALVLVAAFSVTAFAESRECVAILHFPGIEKAECISLDADLESLEGREFNDLVCDPRSSGFYLGGEQFSRDRDSGNIITTNCEWEVRANSGSH